MKPIVAAFIFCLPFCSLANGQAVPDNDQPTNSHTESTTEAINSENNQKSGNDQKSENNQKDENNQATENQSATQNTMTEPPGKPMAFTLHKIADGQCPTCRWISAEGNIVPDTPALFNRFLDDNGLGDPLSYPDDVLVSFHSDGGDILAAIALGREIRKHHFDTTIGETIVKPVEDKAAENHSGDGAANAGNNENNNNNAAKENSENKTTSERVEGICREACVWAFLGGRARNVGNGKLELRTYRPPLDGAGTSSGQEVSVRQQQLADIAYIADYSQEMGFNPLIAFLNWDNANPHAFSSDEIQNYNIDFSPDIIGQWQLVPTNNALVAIASSNDKKTSARLYCDSHKTMFLEISAPTRYSAQNYETYQQTVSTLNIWGMPVNISNLQANLSDGRVVYTVELPKNPLQDWHVDAPFLRGDNAPDALNGIFNIEFSDMPGLKQSARFVMANCPSASH